MNRRKPSRTSGASSSSADSCPVAVLLVGALVAVPFLLAKDPAPVPAAPAVPSASSAQQPAPSSTTRS